MKFSASDGRYTWRGYSPAEIIDDLDIVRRYPKPEDLIVDPRAWLAGQDDIVAAVVHSTAMGQHKIATGLMPGERAHLDNWVEAGLRPWLRRVPSLKRAFRVTKPVLLPKVPKTDPVRRAAVELRAVSARRASLRAALAGEPLHVDIVTVYPETREHLLRQFALLLGVADPGEGDLRRWSVDGLEVDLVLSDASSLTTALKTLPEEQRQAVEALRARRAAVAARYPLCTGRPGLALIEIPGADRFTAPDTDPKSALRLGFADTGRLSQFIQIADDYTADPATRAEAACRDGLRQLGASSAPAHRAGTGVPADLQYVALWVVRKQATTTTKRASRHLVAVRVRPADPEHPVRGWDDQVQDWVPYADLLVSLAAYGGPAADVPTSGLRRLLTVEDERADIERRVRAILFQVRNRPTLLLANAGNLRDSWRWLGNGTLVRDKLGFAGEPDQRSGCLRRAPAGCPAPRPQQPGRGPAVVCARQGQRHARLRRRPLGVAGRGTGQSGFREHGRRAQELPQSSPRAPQARQGAGRRPSAHGDRVEPAVPGTDGVGLPRAGRGSDVGGDRPPAQVPRRPRPPRPAPADAPGQARRGVPEPTARGRRFAGVIPTWSAAGGQPSGTRTACFYGADDGLS